MKQVMKRILSLAMLISTVAVYANDVTPTLVYRSQGFHSDRQKMVGRVGKTHQGDMESNYGNFDLGVGYSRSFKEDKIGRCLFGDDLQCNDCDYVVKVQGSDIRDADGAAIVRDEKAWLADYLYLNCEYNGSFSIKPRIQNVVVDFDLYFGLDDWKEGVYFRAWGPVTWSKWQVGFCAQDPETVLTTSCSAGYMTPSGQETLLSSINSYFAGDKPTAPDTDNITFQGLKWAKMPTCPQTETGFADLRVELGWDVSRSEDSHFGVAIQAAAPTGNSRRADFVMQPVVGNGSHWELGGVITGHSVFWRSEDETRHFGLYVDANLTHQFRHAEQRTFDLKGKNNSRYMLASKFDRNVSTDLFVVDPLIIDTALVSNSNFTVPSHQFANQYAPVANLTTSYVNVKVGVQADITAMFNYTHNDFAWDFGYNFYGRSCERISAPDCEDKCNCDSILQIANQNKWVLKGDTRSFGYLSGMETQVAETAVALSATNSKADIHNGYRNNGRDEPAQDSRNFGADSNGFATPAADDSVFLLSVPVIQGGQLGQHEVRSSLIPVFIKDTDVAVQETRSLSHTVFTNLSYTFDRDTYSPYLGLGGSAEFGKNESCKDACDTSCPPCDSSCQECVDCSLSQWSVWVRGGVSFN